MRVSNETQELILKLSQEIRIVYGIKRKANIKLNQHADFILDVLQDFSNISYNLAISDYVVSEVEKNFLLHTYKWIFSPNKNYNAVFLETIKDQILKFDAEEPEIHKPIHILEKAKRYDQQKKTNYYDSILNGLLEYAKAFTLIDGFESSREFEVIETFKMWITQK